MLARKMSVSIQGVSLNTRFQALLPRDPGGFHDQHPRPIPPSDASLLCGRGGTYLYMDRGIAVRDGNKGAADGSYLSPDRLARLIEGRMDQIDRWRTAAERDRTAFQRSVIEHLTALTQQSVAVDEWRINLEAGVNAYQRSTTAHLEALGVALDMLTAEVHRLIYELYPTPYMTDPSLLMTQDDAGRPQIGYRGGAPLSLRGYRDFEDIFRGSEDFTRTRQRVYLDLLGGRHPVLDVGCGRGEFLDLLAEAGVPAIGVDLDREMIARCHEKGHAVEHADALTYLAHQSDASFGVIFTAQVIEHFAYDQLCAFLDIARRKLMPGGLLVAETINPHSLAAFKTFSVDLTHHHPIFPEVAVALCAIAGFDAAVVHFPHGSGDLAEDRRTQGVFAILATTAGENR